MLQAINAVSNMISGLELKATRSNAARLYIAYENLESLRKIAEQISQEAKNDQEGNDQ